MTTQITIESRTEYAYPQEGKSTHNSDQMRIYSDLESTTTGIKANLLQVVNIEGGELKLSLGDTTLTITDMRAGSDLVIENAEFSNTPTKDTPTKDTTDEIPTTTQGG